MTRDAFHHELVDMETAVLDMGALVAAVLVSAAEVLADRDRVLASRLARNTTVSELRRGIRAQCLSVMARQAPVARDLRELLAIHLAVTELDHISDHAIAMVQHALRLRNSAEPFALASQLKFLMIAMSQHARHAVQALIANDVGQAQVSMERVAATVARCEVVASHVRGTLLELLTPRDTVDPMESIESIDSRESSGGMLGAIYRDGLHRADALVFLLVMSDLARIGGCVERMSREVLEASGMAASPSGLAQPQDEERVVWH